MGQQLTEAAAAALPGWREEGRAPFLQKGSLRVSQECFLP